MILSKFLVCLRGFSLTGREDEHLKTITFCLVYPDMTLVSALNQLVTGVMWKVSSE